MRILAALAFLPLIGCGAGSPGNNANAAAQPANANAPAASTELTPAWLAGRWQSDGPNQCGAGDTSFTLRPDGQYGFMEEQGRWTLEGDRLTIEVTHASSDSGTEAGQRNSTQVRAIGPDEAEWSTNGRPPIRMYRCAG